MADLEAIDYNDAFLYETGQSHMTGRTTRKDVKDNHNWLLPL